MQGDRHRGGGHPPTPATPPYVRDRIRRFGGLSEGSGPRRGIPSASKKRLGRAWQTEGSWLRRQGPRALAAVFRAHRRLTPRCTSSALRRVKCFPLRPQHRPQAAPNPRVQMHEHPGCLAETKVAPPAPKIRRQVLHHLLQAHTPLPTRQFPDALLEAAFRFRCQAPLRRRPPREAETQKLALLRSNHGAFRLVDLESEPLRDEPRYTAHHPLPRSHAADVDAAVVRVAHEAMPASLKLPVQLVQHQVRQQRRQRSALRRSFLRRTDQPVLHHPSVQERSDESSHPLVGYPLQLPILACCLTHTLQSAWPARPARSLARVRLSHVLLGQRPSLHSLRRRRSAFVRLLRRYYAAVRLPVSVHEGLSADRVLLPARRSASVERPRGLPVLARGVSPMPGVFDSVGSRTNLP